MAGVTFRVSGVRCHESGVFYSFFSIYFFYKLMELVDGGSVINGAYHVLFSKTRANLSMEHTLFC